jgi:beta-fructofuranosidase
MHSRRDFLKGFGSAAVLSSADAHSPFFRTAATNQDDSLRARLAADPLRPQFHLLPAKNWMNDPNGPIYWKGRYHMFFQYNPGAAVWGDMHWAHAVSPDMIHWRHLPIALAPSPDGADADGCFTGSAVDDRGTATILYTGVKTSAAEQATLRDGVHNFRETQCLATSRDRELLTWQKWKQPILQPPDDPRLTGFRDPFLWREADLWYLGVASGFRKQGGCVLLYRSRDLREWEYLHPLASGEWNERELVNPVDSGEMWECPDFFPLAAKHVLLYSTAGNVIWEVGELDPKELVFHSQKRGILDHGAYYAQKTQLDARGNRILWGWIPEKRPEAEFSAAGWAGCMALPRLLTIGADGGLEMTIASEAHSLRAKASVLPQQDVLYMDREKALQATQILNIERGRALQAMQIENLCGEFAWRTVAHFSFALTDRTGPWWSLDLEPQGSEMNSPAKLTVNGVSINLPASSQLERDFHLYVDASVAELICDRKHVITTRIYRQPDGPLRITLGDSDLSQLTSLQAWQLRPISTDRLTT